MTDLADIRDKLFCALLSDVMDALGHMNQALLPRIRPLDDTKVMVGRARTALFADVYHVVPGENPYALEIALIDSLLPGEIPVFSCGATGRIAPWGELLSTASHARGAAGALMDGLVRDIRAIRAMGFPVFHGGIAPAGCVKERVLSVNEPVTIGGVEIAPGDQVVADGDAILIVAAADWPAVEAGAQEIRDAEDELRIALNQGQHLADLLDLP